MRPCVSLVLIALGLSLCLTACNGGGTGSKGNPPSGSSPSSGSWQITTQSATQTPETKQYGAYVNFVGGSVSGLYAHEQDPGEGVIGNVSGTMSGNTLTLTLSDPSGLTTQISATAQAGQEASFSGTYTSTNPSDSGAVSLANVPPLAGTWTGTIGSANVSVTMTEQGFDSLGFPSLAGTMTFSGTQCFASGTLTADQRGQYVNGPGLDGVFTQVVGLIQTNNGTILLAYNTNGGTSITESNPAGSSISVSYLVWSGTCGGAYGTGTLSRQ